ncbi:hypothetical protein GGC65_001348 [Sphingopyxis sp. OAS728]|jgi:hypothetical protein|uniref:hypothetical protein n=1 Tax=Sphingopyxis sp. OAS728 TaxID=2663823 RepID=UPI00178AA699|nr:hypothetical protein [Sphingopyxis sp. OAS728]MBE1526892.1 hypothetical protein [Sphingopyxis sp. OAS728]
MLQFLGRLLTSEPPKVRYLNKAEADTIWRDGRLLAVDPQGATFETVVSGVPVAECLPWGSIGAVCVPLKSDATNAAAEART